jgi:hypothetical protein
MRDIRESIDYRVHAVNVRTLIYIQYADLVKRYGREPDQAEYSVWQGSRSSSDSTTITDEDEDAAADALLRLSESPVFSFGTLHDSPEPTISVEAASVTPALPHDADPSSSVPPVLLVEVDPTETGVTRPPPAETVASKPEKVSFFPALSYHENRGLDQNYSAHPLKEYQSPPTPSFSDWIH